MKTASIVLSLTLALSACGGDEEYTGVILANADQAAPSTVAPAVTTPVASERQTGNGEFGYCDFAEEAAVLTQEVNLFEPTEVEAFLGTMLELIDNVEVPQEIEAEFAAQEQMFKEMTQVLEAAGWSIDAVADLDTSVADAGAEALADYEKVNCNVDLDLSDSEPTDAEFMAQMLDTESGRAVFARGMLESADGALTAEQATCYADNVEVATAVWLIEGGDVASQSSDREAIDFLQLLDTCEIPISAFGS